MGNIDKERLEVIRSMPLSEGKHENIEEGMCVMEAVSYVAGEEWSDSPECACPIISEFLRAWNDDLPDHERTSLLSDLIPMIVGTKAGWDVEEKRAHMTADWLIRSATPAWLRLAGLKDQANMLSSLPEITSVGQLSELRPMLASIRKDAESACKVSENTPRAAELGAARNATRAAAFAAAWSSKSAAALDAARAVAWDDAFNAIRDAGRGAIRDAARIAFAAARHAAQVVVWKAARHAVRVVSWKASWSIVFSAVPGSEIVAVKDPDAFVRSAAFEAASNALAETKANLQKSAKDLVMRMCEIK